MTDRARELPEPTNGYHLEHGEERYERGPASVKNEWWELYECGGRYLCTFRDPDDAERVMRQLASFTPPEGDTLSDEVVEQVARAMLEPLGYIGKSMSDAEHIWVGNNIDDAETGSLAYLSRALARAAITALQSRVSPQAGMREALEGIHAARLREDGSDEGYGWNITKLNRAMDAALPLLGKPVPPRPNIDVKALHAAISQPFDGGSDNHGS